MNYVIGVDPGTTGAIGLIHAALKTCLAVHDMPTDEKGMIDLKASIMGEHGVPDAVFVEKCASMPGQGVASTFKFGLNNGMCRLWAAEFAMRWELVSPQTWKKHHGLIKKDKKESLLLARRKWPNAPLERVKDADKAEALLIAEYGLNILRGE
jgi:hypothetical protein